VVAGAGLPIASPSLLGLADDGLLQSHPKDMEEAAMVDGYSASGRSSVWLFLFPRRILTVAIFSFTLVMQEFVSL